MIRIFSPGIRRLPYIETLLGTTVCRGSTRDTWESVDAVAGWGLRKAAQKAIRYARYRGLPYLALEDGFLRSLGPGKKDPPLSIVIDDLGIYYDAIRASRLEVLISQSLSSEQLCRSRRLIALWRQGRVSKYNHQREFIRHDTSRWEDSVPGAPPLPERYVLVVDQTMGDASIKYGQAGKESFQDMLEAALRENPDCSIVLKTHPEVCAGKKRGHFDLTALFRHPRVKVLKEDFHPAGILELAEAVYVVTSQMGFEALIWGKPVRTFGMPFYAGWGLTRDELAAPERRGRVTLEQLVHATLITYPRYVNPETGKCCEVEAVLAHLALQRRMRERFPPQIYAHGFSLLKRRNVRRFFSGSRVHFRHYNERVLEGAAIAIWGSSGITALAGDSPASARPENQGITVRLEDGFLRSVGLGAELVRPLSWVMDRRGIYYDATRPSDLEHLLQMSEFDVALCARATRLRRRIVAAGLTKYNVGKGHWSPPLNDTSMPSGQGNTFTGRRVILVPGQVETDASIRYGASSIRRNIDLLRAVRKANPSAYIIYKPHPDVLRGLRLAGDGEAEACAYCDERVEDVPVNDLMENVDEVHVITSLTGFEALLRGIPVTTYGQPFYAGWGLTEDRALTDEVAQRRTRKLLLDELVAGVLILYPAYVSRTTGRFTSPERALDELIEWREHEEKESSLWRIPLRWVLRSWGVRP